MTCLDSEFGDCCSIQGCPAIRPSAMILGEKVKQKIADGVTDIFQSSQQSTDIAKMESSLAAQETVMLDPVRLTMEAHR